MDAPVPHQQAQTRRASRPPPPYPRASPRCSNAARPHAPASHSASSSLSHASPSQLAKTHAPHRFHHAHCTKQAASSPRPSSQAMAYQDSPDAAPQQGLSSFLHERLQRERRAESDKMAYSASLSRAEMSASVDVDAASPFRPPFEHDGNRPRSSAGSEPRKKGLGVKEMEQVMSNLHKQNFDLKLELFHRRERQTALEERLDALESDKKQMEDVNDTLIEELEKRDKAVEEAVAMIIMLEARIGQLVEEREMARDVESQALFCQQDCQPPCPDPDPRDPVDDDARSQKPVRVITRMPSFVSEPTETTENLRSVYLGVKSGAPALPRVAEASPDAEQPAPGSPTLSVLSESSFMSVYGQRGNDKSVGLGPPAHIDEPLLLDGLSVSLSSSRIQDAVVAAPRRRAMSAAKAACGVKPPPRSNTAVPFASCGTTGYGSPLQRLERLDASYSSNRDAMRPHSQGRALDYQFMPPRPLSRRQARDGKRETLRRVTTDAPGGVRLHDQGLPPTPDTISTSTLNRFKSSHETLLAPHEAPIAEANYGVPLLSAGRHVRYAEPASGALLGGRLSAKDADMARRVSESSCSDHGHRQCVQRTRSADGSIVSRREDNGWESDIDDSDDVRSLRSSMDIWLRESGKPGRGDGGDGGLGSPALFDLTAKAGRGGWAMDKMFGPRSPRTGGATATDGHGFARDLFSVQSQLFSSASSGPPPPDRRSSLHARTGSGTTTGSLGPSSSKNSLIREAWRSSPKSRPRHERASSDGMQSGGGGGGARTPVLQQAAAAAALAPPPQASGDQKRYPPLSNAQGARAGLNRLFRRSIGGSSSSNAAASDPTSSPNSTAESSFSEPRAGHAGVVGVPSWVLRNCALDEERSGATPPPITLKARHGRRNTLDSLATVAEPPAAPPPAQAHDEALPPAAPATGARRKWLPTFGRASSTKHKAG